MTHQITQAEITKALTAAANADLRIARTRGHVMICQTKLGNLELSRTETGYRLIRCGRVEGGREIEPSTLAEGKAGAIRSVLVGAYVVEFAD